MNCPKCKEAMYVIDTRKGPAKNTRSRFFCCFVCDNRYMSLEVLNPTPYKNKPMPDYVMKKLGIQMEGGE